MEKKLAFILIGMFLGVALCIATEYSYKKPERRGYLFRHGYLFGVKSALKIIYSGHENTDSMLNTSLSRDSLFYFQNLD